MSIAYGTNSADRSKAQQAWAKSQQSMASKYGIKPSNAMTYSFGRAAPKSPDQQQGQLAEPPKQNNQAAQQQFGSAQASGDYSAYSNGGSYAPYQGQTQGTPQYGSPGGAWLGGTPYFDESSGQYTDPNGVVRQRPARPDTGYGSRIGKEGQIGTADWRDGDADGIDDRYQPGPGQAPPQGPARNQYYQQLQQYNDAQASQGNDVPVYAAQAPQAAPQQYVFPMQGQGQQFYNQRDAFINNINTSLGQQMMQNFGGSQPVPPQLNIPQLWNQAGQMAANGWTNPLAGLFGNV